MSTKSVRFKCPVKCRFEAAETDSLAKYIAVVSALPSDRIWWFRGQRDSSWKLVPSALRYDTLDERQTALTLQKNFRIIAETKLRKVPGRDEKLQWMQLAQHYGLPTRLLDWTEVAMYALFFACEIPKKGEKETNGVVFLMDPNHISHLKGKPHENSLDAHLNEAVLGSYFEVGGKQSSRGLPTVSIRPVWNSERLMMQRSVFTLHGSRQFDLDSSQAPSLVGIPILMQYKEKLRRELSSNGVDRMMLFPELEYACRTLLERANLCRG